MLFHDLCRATAVWDQHFPHFALWTPKDPVEKVVQTARRACVGFCSEAPVVNSLIGLFWHGASLLLAVRVPIGNAALVPSTIFPTSQLQRAASKPHTPRLRPCNLAGLSCFPALNCLLLFKKLLFLLPSPFLSSFNYLFAPAVFDPFVSCSLRPFLAIIVPPVEVGRSRL